MAVKNRTKHIGKAAIMTIGLLYAGASFGQSGGLTPPSNLPPEGYSQLIWVDNRGCRYIRNTAGNGITWIPQVRINGKHICDPNSANFVADRSVGPKTTAPADAPTSAPVPVDSSKPLKVGDQEINELDSLPPRPNAGAAVAPAATAAAGSNTDVNLLDELPPTLLDKEPPVPTPDAVAAAPAVPTPAPATPDSDGFVAPSSAGVDAVLPSVTATPEPQIETVIEVAPEPVPEPEPTPAPAPAPEQYFVQVGQYADPTNSANVQERVRKSGFGVIVERDGDLDRIYAVVPQDQARANKALAFLRRYGFADAQLVKK